MLPITLSTVYKTEEILRIKVKVGAGGGNRTLTRVTSLRILSPMRLPIPPHQRVFLYGN